MKRQKPIIRTPNDWADEVKIYKKSISKLVRRFYKKLIKKGLNDE